MVRCVVPESQASTVRDAARKKLLGSSQVTGCVRVSYIRGKRAHGPGKTSREAELAEQSSTG